MPVVTQEKSTDEEKKLETANHLLRATAIKRFCVCCDYALDDSIHGHVSFTDLTPIIRNSGLFTNTYRLGGKFLEGYNLLLLIDTQKTDSDDVYFTVSDIFNEFKIMIRPRSVNCIEVAKMPKTKTPAASPKKKLKKKNSAQDFEIAIKLNGAEPTFLNLPGDPTHSRMVSTPISENLVIAYWKERSGK